MGKERRIAGNGERVCACWYRVHLCSSGASKGAVGEGEFSESLGELGKAQVGAQTPWTMCFESKKGALLRSFSLL